MTRNSTELHEARQHYRRSSAVIQAPALPPLHSPTIQPISMISQSTAILLGWTPSFHGRPALSCPAVLQLSSGVQGAVSASASAATPSRTMPSSIELNCIPDGILLYNEHGDIEEVNVAMCELFGYSVEQLKGHPLEVLLPDNVRALHHKFTEAVFADMERREMAHRTQVYGRHAAGFNIEIGIHLAPCIVDGAKAVWCVVRDKRKYNEALSLRQAATQHAESMTGFLRLLNHEVRTSVHGCAMALDSVRHDLDTPATAMEAGQWKLPPSWTLLEDTISRMSTLLTDMVDLRNLQDGNLSCPSVHFNIETVVEQLLQGYPFHRTPKHQQLHIATQACVPVMFGSMEALVKGVVPLIGQRLQVQCEGKPDLARFPFGERPAIIGLHVAVHHRLRYQSIG